MAFVDKFYGGPLDGQEQLATEGVEDFPVTPVLDPESLAQYERSPSLDTEVVRAWVPTRKPLEGMQQLGIHAARGEHLTLDQLASLVDGARGLGLPGTAPVKALLSFSGKIKSLTVDPVAK